MVEQLHMYCTGVSKNCEIKKLAALDKNQRKRKKGGPTKTIRKETTQ